MKGGPPMGQYRLTTKFMRDSKKVMETGRVVSQRVYRQGDIVEMDDERAARFLRSGTLVPLTDSAGSDGRGDEATTEPESPMPDPEPSEGSPEADGDDGAVGSSADDEPQDDPSVIDLYELSYAELQQEAKARGLSAGGSKEEILNRILGN